MTAADAIALYHERQAGWDDPDIARYRLEKEARAARHADEHAALLERVRVQLENDAGGWKPLAVNENGARLARARARGQKKATEAAAKASRAQRDRRDYDRARYKANAETMRERSRERYRKGRKTSR